MTRRRRIALFLAGSVIGPIVIGAIVAVVVLQTDWFFNLVRGKIVSTVETATGGRVEIGRFAFDWKRLRAEVDNFVLHGTEPAGKPPLFRAGRVAVGLKIVSLAKRDVDIDYLEVDRPQAYLILGPDGKTNVPEPKVKKKSDKNAVETILDLAIGRFDLRGGSVEVESRGATPFDASGKNLQAHLLYEVGGPRYRGEISMDPLDFRYGDYAPLPLSIATKVAIEKNRIQISDGRIRTGNTSLALNGTLEDLNNPRASAQYDLHADVAEVGRILKLASQQSGTVMLGGSATWAGGSNYSVTGNLHAFNIDYRDGGVRVRDAKADAAVEAAPGRAQVNGLRLTGVYADKRQSLPLSAQVRSVVLEGENLDANGVAVAALGGSFRGSAKLRGFNQYEARGDLAGFEIKRLVGMYSKEPLPWDGRLSGPVEVAGSLKGKNDLRAKAKIGITPAPAGPPVTGSIAVNYDARRNVLDLDRSFVALPNSRLELSGSVGKQVRVHVETRNLRDILPVVGAGDLPLKIESGAIVFDGTVSGKAESPNVAGRLTTGRVSYSGMAFDSLQANLAGSENGASVDNLMLARGKLRAQAKGTIALTKWKPVPSSAISASLTARDADLTDLLAMANQKDVAVTGMLGASATVSGTFGDPVATADLNVAKGSVEQEPFDQLTAQVTYRTKSVEIAKAQLKAGRKQAELTASFTHPEGSFDRGRIKFQLSTNAMPLEDVKTLERARPGIRGNLIATASGEAELLPAKPGLDRFRLLDVTADVRGRGLQMTNQPLGDFRLTAQSQGGEVKLRLASDFANSRIRGDGQFRLSGDYPGSATVTFTRLDFGELSDWISPRTTARQNRIAGSAEGELQVSGPAARPQLMKGTLRIPKIEFGPAPGTGIAPGGTPLMLRNEGPIVVSMNNQVVSIESAHLVGRSTDISVTGKVMLQQKNPLDVRVNGRVDLGILHSFDRDIYSSGIVQADANVRGALSSPQLTGKMELKNAALSMTDVPNGLSAANGTILFTGDRATIQNLTGESGGGEIELSGFAGYGGGEIVFRLHASATEVRVRYPEGVSTVADAELDFTGTTSRSQLSGTVTIVRTGFNPQSDFSSILAKSSEPVRTPSANTGFLGGLIFDIQIETSPDITFQSSLAEGLQVEANLRLRGTASNPALLGRINITQGQLAFFGTKYTINQGTVAFYNPVKIEPVLNIDLETKARGVDVTLTVSGPINKLTLTPRSDPPLQFNEIVSLLATGRTPTSDPSLLAQQTTSPQSWQQMGASTLLGQAIANPVAGRLQRFFGVSKLKIDPSLTGVENNPQARLTLEQQVTRDITFTYITNVTSSNPQVVQVEWAFGRQWSVVALREENGQFGLDFFYKKRFK
jgi:translocation and assembly module TamB